MKKLTIDRNIWRRGGSSNDILHGDTRLLNEQGFMCCLGFFCEQAGIPKNYLDTGEPFDIGPSQYLDLIPELATPLEEEDGYVNTILTTRAIQINDDPTLTNKEREIQLTTLFAVNNIDVEFINKYPE